MNKRPEKPTIVGNRVSWLSSRSFAEQHHLLPNYSIRLPETVTVAQMLN
jgi:hypothetical protein